MKRLFIITSCAILIFIANLNLFAQDKINKTIIKDEAAKTKLLGEHKLSLQWIAWDKAFGKIVVTDDNGLLRIKGEQKSNKDGDFVSVDGVIKSVDVKDFIFQGTVITRVSYINKGEPCKREGEMKFRITGARKFWRMQNIDNPCDEAADYVDVHFRK